MNQSVLPPTLQQKQLLSERPTPRVLLDYKEAKLLNEELMDTSSWVGVDSEWYQNKKGRSPVNNGLSFCWTFCWRRSDGKLELVYLHNHGFSSGNVYTLRSFWTSKERIKICHNVPADYHILANHGIVGESFTIDTMVLDFLVDEIGWRDRRLIIDDRIDHDLKTCAKDWLGHERTDYNHTFGTVKLKKNGQPYADGRLDVPPLEEVINDPRLPKFKDTPIPEKLVNYACDDAFDGYLLVDVFEKELKKRQWQGGKTHWDYFLNIESNITEIICKMERRGMPLDLGFLKEMHDVAKRDLERIDARVVEITGLPMNPGSDKQKQALLFGTAPYEVKKSAKQKESFIIHGLGLPVQGLTKAELPAVDASSLKRLRKLAKEEEDKGLEELLTLLVNRSAIDTQISTFFVGLQEKQVNGKIHTRINQIGAASGRTSCLASWVPVRTLRGFVPISNIRIGDLVWTHRNRWRPVLATTRKGIDHMYSVRFSNGQVLTCTTYHKLLTSEKGWVEVGELINGYVKTLGERSVELCACSRSLQKEGLFDDSTDCGSGRYYVSQRALRASPLHARSRAQSAGEIEVFSFEDRQQESDERQNRETASQLEGGMRGWLRVFDLSLQREAEIRTLCCDDGSTWIEGASQCVRSASHRQQPEEQQPRQLSACDVEGSQGYSLLASEGFDVCRIEEVHYSGSFEVYDITVDEDASYEACGVFSHNSAGPNLQNITTGDKDTYFLRDCFCAPPGRVLIVADFGQLEYRLLAHFTQDPKLLHAFRENLDMHSYTGYNIYPNIKAEVDERFGGPVKEALDWIAGEYPDDRKRAKTLNFEIIYGVGHRKLADQLEITDRDGKRMIDGWFETYAGVRVWQRRVLQHAREKGYVLTLLNRRCYANLKKLNNEKYGPRGEEERRLVNSVIQGSAADICETAMRLIERDRQLREWDYMQIMQIHDELVGHSPRGVHKQVCSHLEGIMSNPFSKPLRVELPVSVGYGPTWSTAK